MFGLSISEEQEGRKGGRGRRKEGKKEGGREGGREGKKKKGKEGEGGRGRETDLVCSCILSLSDCFSRTCKSPTADLSFTFSSLS